MKQLISGDSLFLSGYFRQDIVEIDQTNVYRSKLKVGIFNVIVNLKTHQNSVNYDLIDDKLYPQLNANKTSFLANNLIKTTDGFFLIGEEVLLDYNTQRSKPEGGILYYQKYYGTIVTKINNNGKVEWTKVLPKINLAPSRAYPFLAVEGCFIAKQIENDLYIFQYSTDKNAKLNIDTFTQDQIDYCQTYNGAVIMIYKINTNGTVIKSSFKYNLFKLQPNIIGSGVLTNTIFYPYDKSAIIYFNPSNYEHFGRLSFD
jgi:hypothetical protein